MQNTTAVSPSKLSDVELIAQVKNLAARERGATAQLVAHLAELDARELYLKAGYASLFVYCRDALALSEHEAYLRIEAARASRRFPVILEMVAEGALNLTSVRLLASHLTADNHLAVLESARGKRKAEVEEIVARLSPRPDVPTRFRKLPEPAAPQRTAAVEPAAPVAPAPPSPPSPPPALPAVTTPLAVDRYKLQLTIGAETLEKWRLAKDMLSHAIPSGDDAAILDRALTLLLADLARKKFAATEKPRPGRDTVAGSRHIPAEVKRAVWVRDIGRCAYVGEGGHRCAERRFLEFHHVKPYAAGGEATVANCSLRCRRHNGYEAKLFFARDDGRGPGEVREDAVCYGVERPNTVPNSVWTEFA